MARRDEWTAGLVAPFTLSALLHAAVATLLFNSLTSASRWRCRRCTASTLSPRLRVRERDRRGEDPEPPKTTTSVTPPTRRTVNAQGNAAPEGQTRAARLPPGRRPREAKVAPAPKATAQRKPSRRQAARRTHPRPGGGPTGGKGTDVATVRSDGIEFPFPGYLNNIVRQIALNFKPRNASARLKAEVRFLIHRDGSVSDITFVQQVRRFLVRSGGTGRGRSRFEHAVHSVRCRRISRTTCFPSCSASTRLS